MSAAQAWRLLGTGDLEAIARGVQPLVRAWADEWLPDAAPTATAVDAHAHSSLQVQAGEQLLALKNEQGGLGAVAMYGSGILTALQAQSLAALGVPPEQRGDGVHAALALYQLRDLLARLARLPAGSARKATLYSQDRALRPTAAKGSGAVLVQLALNRDAVRVWLPHDAVASWCRRPSRSAGPALTARTEALAGRRLPFQLQAGCASLALADLLRLQPGNVIRLETGLDQPMELITEEGTGFGRGYLGLQQGRPVIQLCS